VERGYLLGVTQVNGVVDVAVRVELVAADAPGGGEAAAARPW